MAQTVSSVQQAASLGVFGPDAVDNPLGHGVCRYKLPAGYGDCGGVGSSAGAGNCLVRLGLQDLRRKQIALDDIYA